MKSINLEEKTDFYQFRSTKSATKRDILRSIRNTQEVLVRQYKEELIKEGRDRYLAEQVEDAINDYFIYQDALVNEKGDIV